MARRPPGGTRAQREGVTQRRKAGVPIQLDVGGVKTVLKNLTRLKLNVGRRVVNQALGQATKRIIQPAVDANIASVSPGRFGTGRLKTLGTEVKRVGKKLKSGRVSSTSVRWMVITPSRTDLNIQSDRGYSPAILEVGGKVSGFAPVRVLEGQHMLKRARDQKAPRFRTFVRRTIKKFMDAEIKRIAGRNVKRIAAGKKPISPFRSFRQRTSFKRRGIL